MLGRSALECGDLAPLWFSLGASRFMRVLEFDRAHRQGKKKLLVERRSYRTTIQSAVKPAHSIARISLADQRIRTSHTPLAPVHPLAATHPITLPASVSNAITDCSICSSLVSSILLWLIPCKL